MIHQWAAHIHFQWKFSTWKEKKPCSHGTTKIFVPRTKIELATLRMLWRSDVLTTEPEGREFDSRPGRVWFLLLSSWKCPLEMYVLLTSVSLKSKFQRSCRKKQTGMRALFRGTQRRFPQNTFQAIQSTFSSPEMHSKRCYKICICSVVLGQLESFRNYKGLRIIFQKILDAILS